MLFTGDDHSSALDCKGCEYSARVRKPALLPAFYKISRSACRSVTGDLFSRFARINEEKKRQAILM